MTTRQAKVGSLLKKEISHILLTEDFPEITGVVTVLKVEVSVDMKHARVFLSVIQQDETVALEVLKKHLYEIQGILNKRLVMKFVPRLELVIDDSADEALRLTKMIDKLSE